MIARTIPYYDNVTQARFFVNPTYGNELNQNGVGAVALDIFDATDSALWGWNVIQNNANDFVISTTQNHTPAGTKSLSFGPSETDDIFDILKTSTIDLSAYSGLSGWLYSTAWAGDGDITIYGYNTETPGVVGTAVNLSTYINAGELGAWQQFSIPLVDMGLCGATIDSFRFKMVGASPPTGFLDDFSLLTGGGYIYTLAPAANEDLAVKSLSYSLADTLDTTLADATLPAIDYATLLGATPTVGVRFTRTQGDTVLFTAVWHSLGDLLISPGATLGNRIATATTVFMTLDFVYPEPALLRGALGDAINIQVNDDLTGLDLFKVTSGCYLRQRS